MVEIVTDPNILKEIEKKTLSEKLNIEGGEIVTDPKIIDQVIKKNEQKNVKDEDSFYDKYITGEARTQFPNIPEIGSMNILKEDGTNDITKNALAAVALQLTPSTEAQIDIIKKITPGTIVSKDIYDNPILTFPKNMEVELFI
jgi:Pyruvate/2-oxoacid:ferredoxin oxidoreductase gamma subunit